MTSSTAREEGLVDSIKERFGEDIKVNYIEPKRFKITVPSGAIVEVAKFVKGLGFDHATSVSGVDWPKENCIEVVYHLSSYSREDMRDLVMALATRLPRDKPEMPTLYQVWKSVEFHERETFEMFGVTFHGHPKLERLLLPEDWADIPPLRKDFKSPGRE